MKVRIIPTKKLPREKEIKMSSTAAEVFKCLIKYRGEWITSNFISKEINMAQSQVLGVLPTLQSYGFVKSKIFNDCKCYKFIPQKEKISFKTHK